MERSLWADLDGPTHYVELAPAADGVQAPPVVLVHGLSGAYANWLSLGPLLGAEGRRVLALDLPGHGLTRPGLHDPSVEGLVDLLGAFVEQVAGGRALLVGNSLGGLLCLLQASAQPESVEGLALLAPAVPTGRARLHPVTAAGFAGYALPGVGELMVSTRRRRCSPEQLVAQSLWMCCHDPSRVSPDLVERHVELLRVRAGFRRLDAAFLATVRTLLRNLLRPRRLHTVLENVDCPVLLVQGTSDKLVPVAAARAVARAHPGWEYRELEDVGHVPQMEAPERTAELIRAWMDGPLRRAHAEGRASADIIAG